MPAHRLLKQVREQRHFELEDVAALAQIAPTRLEDFEEGQRTPSYKQLEKLADVYGVPSYVLFSGTPPNLQESLPDFRRTDPRPARLTPAGMRKIWGAERISEFASQLATAVGFDAPPWTPKVGSPTVKTAGTLRRFFNEWARKRSASFQFTGPAEQSFLGAFRLFIESQAIVVNVNDAPASDFMGFYLERESGSPLVYVNRSISSKKAQLFTLVHEYAHHLLGIEGVSNPFRVRNSVERSCNRFAAEFLAPMPEFNKIVERQSGAVRNSPEELVSFVSSASLLSKQAAAMRLVEGGHLTRAQLAGWWRTNRQLPDAEKREEALLAGEARGQVHAKRVGELGYLPVYLAHLGVDRGLIDSLDVQAGLGLSEPLQGRAFSLAARRLEAARSE